MALVADAAIASANVTLGFGKHIQFVDRGNLATIGLLGQLGGTFSILSAVWSKTSFGITLLRVTEGKTKVFVWFVIVSMNVAMGLSALFTWIQCSPVAKNWEVTLPGFCWDHRVNVAYGIFSGAYSAFMDWVLALLPWKLLWSLQMKRKEKVGVGIAMSMGLLYVCPRPAASETADPYHMLRKALA